MNLPAEEQPVRFRIADEPACYSITVFTLRWKEVRDFYVDILDARVLSERSGRYCEMILGGLPICLHQSEVGEAITYLHLYITLKTPQSVLRALRSRGIIITNVGPYTNFRDPEGRVIKLSADKTMVD